MYLTQHIRNAIQQHINLNKEIGLVEILSGEKDKLINFQKSKNNDSNLVNSLLLISCQQNIDKVVDKINVFSIIVSCKDAR